MFARVFSFSRNRRERLVRLGSEQATVEPSIRCIYTSFIAKIILSEAVAAPAATADQTAVRPSPRRRPRVSKLARRPRLSSCPFVLVPSFACVDRGGNRTDPPFVFEQAQFSRQRCSLKTEFRRQLGDGERAGLCERGQNGELGCTKPAPSKMSLVMLGHGPAGVAQGRARASATRVERR